MYTFKSSAFFPHLQLFSEVPQGRAVLSCNEWDCSSSTAGCRSAAQPRTAPGVPTGSWQHHDAPRRLRGSGCRQSLEEALSSA